MLAQLAARIRQRHVENAGNVAEGGENDAGTAAPHMTGDMEHIILEENCRVRDTSSFISPLLPEGAFLQSTWSSLGKKLTVNGRCL